MAYSFWDHLDALRKVLLKSLGAWLAGTIGAFVCKEPLFDFLLKPLGEDNTLINIEVTAQFLTHVQVALCVGFVIALPFFVWWFYGFIEPALYRQEKKQAVVFLLVSLLLFGAGVTLNWFVIFPLSFRFLSLYQVSRQVVNQFSLTSYFSLLMVLSVMMGLFFEVPVITWLLNQTGLIRKQQLKRFRAHVLIAILILAALITPTGDPFTLLLVSLPVYALYEISILII